MKRLIPVFTTRGDVGAFLSYPYLYNRSGEWIGWVTPQRDVYSVHGTYAGWLTTDPRILCRRSRDITRPRLNAPPPPPRITPPSTVPLAPMMAEISFGVMDILDEDPDLLPSLDFGEMRLDLD